MRLRTPVSCENSAVVSVMRAEMYLNTQLMGTTDRNFFSRANAEGVRRQAFAFSSGLRNTEFL